MSEELEMTRTTAPYQSTTHDVAAGDRVVVAVNANDPGVGATRWASREAARLHVPLQLVCASRYPAAQGPPEAAYLEPRDGEQLESMARTLSHDVEVLGLEVHRGPPMSVVLDHVDEHTRYLVVGHRGLGAARRALSGSMSIAIAGRSPVPVVVVPDGWEPGTHASAPVVAGVSLHAEGVDAVGDAAVLQAAFERAHELHAPLVVVHAWEIPALLSWSPNDIEDLQRRVTVSLASCLAPWRARYPDVEVSTQVVAERPSDALRDAARVAQLIILGRRKPATRHGGFHAESTARLLLHHLTVPVLELPAPITTGTTQARKGLDTWAPMY
jgi:nucleotide-binding universal stress UspA family protein